MGDVSVISQYQLHLNKLINQEVTAVLDELEENLIQEGETIIHQVDAFEAIQSIRSRYE